MNYTQQNKDLINALATANEAERKLLIERFLSLNGALIRGIAAQLFKDWTGQNDYDDVVINVQISVMEVLDNPNALKYLEDYTFWTIASNRTKEKLHNERGTSINYQTFKRYTREAQEKIPATSSLDDMDLQIYSFKSLGTDVEEDFINKSIRDEFNEVFEEVLSQREKDALLCKKYPEYGEPISRRTYSRIRANARAKLMANLTYAYDEYVSAFRK